MDWDCQLETAGRLYGYLDSDILLEGFIRVVDNSLAHHSPLPAEIEQVETQRDAEYRAYSDAKRLAAEARDKAMRAANAGAKRQSRKKANAKKATETELDGWADVDGLQEREDPAGKEQDGLVSPDGHVEPESTTIVRDTLENVKEIEESPIYSPLPEHVAPLKQSSTPPATPVTELSNMLERFSLRSPGSEDPERLATVTEQEPLSDLHESTAQSTAVPGTSNGDKDDSVALEPTPPPPLPISIPTSSRSLPWFVQNGDKGLAMDLARARKSGLWTYPKTHEETLRYKVFCALWEKGYYITSGSKFGGDYLMYPGTCGFSRVFP